MRPFMDADFLLSTETARKLYHEVAEKMPIVDYHCHISPKQIAENKPLRDIAEVWLGGDHYKWRVMRGAGIPEELVTGNTSGLEKFKAFAEVMPQLIGNPIYHWSHLELQRGFGITEPLNPKNAEEIYAKCNAVLATTTPRDMMHKFGVKALCTTDDPCDDLHWHEAIKNDPEMDVQVLPAFRPDAYINIEKDTFLPAMARLSETVGKPMETAQDVADALVSRIDFFHSHGAVAADHGMDYCMFGDSNLADIALQKVMKGEKATKAEMDGFKTFVTVACAKRYAELGMVMQIHFGCLRNVNKPMFGILGADTGYDAVNVQSGAENLGPLLNAFLENQGLPKMILYSLNPVDNTAVQTIAACFRNVRMGSAWWFNDHIPGMENQLTDLATNGVLAKFVGMLTDSRSLLSYTRHEYFRRVLCNLLGKWVEEGRYPNDEESLNKMVADICYHNTKAYFGFQV